MESATDEETPAEQSTPVPVRRFNGPWLDLRRIEEPLDALRFTGIDFSEEMTIITTAEITGLPDSKYVHPPGKKSKNYDEKITTAKMIEDLGGKLEVIASYRINLLDERGLVHYWVRDDILNTEVATAQRIIPQVVENLQIEWDAVRMENAASRTFSEHKQFYLKLKAIRKQMVPPKDDSPGEKARRTTQMMVVLSNALRHPLMAPMYDSIFGMEPQVDQTYYSRRDYEAVGTRDSSLFQQFLRAVQSQDSYDVKMAICERYDSFVGDSNSQAALPMNWLIQNACIAVIQSYAFSLYGLTQPRVFILTSFKYGVSRWMEEYEDCKVELTGKTTDGKKRKANRKVASYQMWLAIVDYKLKYLRSQTPMTDAVKTAIREWEKRRGFLTSKTVNRKKMNYDDADSALTGIGMIVDHIRGRGYTDDDQEEIDRLVKLRWDAALREGNTTQEQLERTIVPVVLMPSKGYGKRYGMVGKSHVMTNNVKKRKSELLDNTAAPAPKKQKTVPLAKKKAAPQPAAATTTTKKSMQWKPGRQLEVKTVGRRATPSSSSSSSTFDSIDKSQGKLKFNKPVPQPTPKQIVIVDNDDDKDMSDLTYDATTNDGIPLEAKRADKFRRAQPSIVYESRDSASRIDPAVEKDEDADNDRDDDEIVDSDADNDDDDKWTRGRLSSNHPTAAEERMQIDNDDEDDDISDYDGINDLMDITDNQSGTLG